MNRKLSLAEILNFANTIADTEERRSFLQQYDCSVLRMLIIMIYDMNLKWDLPSGEPPFVKNTELDSYGTLYGQLKKLIMFHAGARPDIPPMKKQMLFIQLLESIHPADAELLIKIKDQDYTKFGSNNWKSIYPKLQRNFLRTTFPGIHVLPLNTEVSDEQVI